jgi:mono/diheme cytochrome c family protein
MKQALAGIAIFGVATALTAGTSLAQTSTDYGKRLYDTNCAVCHGFNGKGNGPYKDYLTRDPSDLTMLAKNNNGVFPVGHIYQVIDGRWEVGAHGPREMPIWGYGYLFRPANPNMLLPNEMEAAVRVRILALLDYLHRLQMK